MARVQAATTAPAGVIVGKTEGGVLSQRDDVMVHVNNGLAKEALSLTLESSVDPVVQIERRIEGEAAHVADALNNERKGYATWISNTIAANVWTHVSCSRTVPVMYTTAVSSTNGR